METGAEDAQIPPGSSLLHASCVAVSRTDTADASGADDAPREAGLLILGPAGSGKSSLALMLMAWGARLVGDDNLLVRREGGSLVAISHPRTAGLIEARGVGILTAAPPQPAQLALAVDLGRVETARLPQLHHIECLGIALPLVLGPVSAHLAAALLHQLRHARHA